ncbi:MAG: hypothetical protein ABSB32_19910 [Thermodesulfobacteriota bacterium]
MTYFGVKICYGQAASCRISGAVYHITGRGNEKRAIFLEAEDRVRLLEKLEDYHDRFGILIHSYVLMDNHYHYHHRPFFHLIQYHQPILFLLVQCQYPFHTPILTFSLNN